jgi:hypothetical protein
MGLERHDLRMNPDRARRCRCACRRKRVACPGKISTGTHPPALSPAEFFANHGQKWREQKHAMISQARNRHEASWFETALTRLLTTRDY